MRQDHEFWSRCEQRWGQGQGYRSAIRDMTDQPFVNSYDAAQTFVLKLMSDEWVQIVATLEDMLQEKGDPTAGTGNLTGRTSPEDTDLTGEVWEF